MKPNTVIWPAVMFTGVLLIVLMAGCASSGLYAMSDNWCDAHPHASAAKCAR